MLKNFLLISFTFCYVSCTPFSEISKDTKFEKEGGYIKVYNLQAGMQSFTFGDFQFAVNKTQFKELSESKPEFRDILFYAKTTDVPYEYYVLFNPQKLENNDEYLYKDTLMANSRFVLANSKNAPASDIKFIMDKLTAIK